MQHVGPSLNVVYLYDAFEDDTHVHLVLEYCRGGVRDMPSVDVNRSLTYAASVLRQYVASVDIN